MRVAFIVMIAGFDFLSSCYQSNVDEIAYYTYCNYYCVSYDEA